MPELNKPLLRKTLRFIEAHPEQWDQTELRCGTSACFAGHAALLVGSEWTIEDATFEPEMKASKELDRPREDVWNRAVHVLGLTDSQACRLFDTSNTLPTLRKIVKDLCKPAKQRSEGPKGPGA